MIVQPLQIDPGLARATRSEPAPPVPEAAAAVSAVRAAQPVLPEPLNMQAVVAAIDRVAKALNQNIELSLDEESGRTLLRVVDSETGELLRQIPSEEALNLSRALDKIAGLLIDRTA